MSKKIKYGLLYTEDEPDEFLMNYVEGGDWIQLRKGFSVKSFSRRKIYRIESVVRKKRDMNIYASLFDNTGEERIVDLRRFKYITIQQRLSVEARAMNPNSSEKNPSNL